MSTITREQPRAELELQARYVMLTTLAEDRRILDLAADPHGLLLLAEAGAAELTGASAEPEALRQQLADVGVEGVDVIPRPELPLAFADAAFDLVIFPDLAAALSADQAWIAELRRILAPDGYLVLALPNPNGRRLSDLVGESFAATLTYEEAFARLSPAFGSLTVFVQSPLLANLFYDLESAEEDPGLVFDRSLLAEEADEAGWYLLVFGPTPIHRDDLSIVQVPFAPVVQAVRAQPAEKVLTEAAALADDKAIAELRAEKEELAARVLSLQDELVQQQHELRTLAAQLAAPPAEVIEPPVVGDDLALRQRLAEFEAGVAEQASESAMLRERIAALKLERRALEEKLGRAREQLAASSRAQAEAQSELELWRPRISALKEERSALETTTQELRQRLVTIEDTAAAERAAANAIREQLAAAQVERDAATAETELLRQRLSDLSEQQQRMATELEQAHNAGQEASVEQQNLVNELQVLRERVAALKLDRERDQAQLGELRAASLVRTEQETVGQVQLVRLRERIKALKVDRRVGQEKLAQLRAKQVALAREQETLLAERELNQQRSAALLAEREALQTSLNELRQQHLGSESARQEHEQRLQLAEQRIAALKQDRDQLAERLQTQRQQALERSQEAQVAQEAALQLQAERDQLTARLAANEDEHAKTVHRLQEQIAGLTANSEQAAAAAARMEELEAELARQTHDRASFESQIKDLLEETAELRDAADGQGATEVELATLTAERDGLQESVRQEKVRNEKLREDLARLHSKLSGVEAENRTLAAELQRLTDALHDAQSPASSPPVSVHDAETVVMTSPLLTSTPEPARDKPAPAPRRDSVGRPLEDLDEIEDLLAGAVPPSPNRR